MDPVDRTRELLPGNGDLRPQKDRKMSFCEFKKIRLICERTLRACLTASTPQMPSGYQPFDILQKISMAILFSLIVQEYVKFIKFIPENHDNFY
jgi:hypothetical protein